MFEIFTRLDARNVPWRPRPGLQSSNGGTHRTSVSVLWALAYGLLLMGSWATPTPTTPTWPCSITDVAQVRLTEQFARRV